MSADAQWTWYESALAALAAGKPIPAIRESYPESGFYKHYTGEPVAIWREVDGALVMLLGGAEVIDIPEQRKAWVSSARKPVLRAVYDQRIEHGAWPAEVAPAPVTTEAPQAAGSQPGHNEQTLTPFAALCAEAETALGKAKGLLGKPIAAKPDADAMQDLANTLRGIWQRSDDARKLDNAPHRRAIEENDLRWAQQVLGPVKETGAQLVGTAEAWGRAEVARIRAEAEKKARAEHEARMATARAEAEERRKAEQARLDAERAAAEAAREAAVASGESTADLPPVPEPAVVTVDPVQLPAFVPPVVDAKIMLGTGTGGNRRGVKTKAEKQAVITDLAAAALFLAKADNDELRKAVQKIADRAAKTGVAFDGITLTDKAA